MKVEDMAKIDEDGQAVCLDISEEEKPKKRKRYFQTIKCEKCNTKIKEAYGSGRFCSQKCARSFSTASNREAISKKTSDTIRKKFLEQSVRNKNPNIKNKKQNNNENIYKTKNCENCEKEFQYIREKRFCDKICAIRYQYDKRNPNYEENIRKARLAGIASSQSQRETRRSKNEIYFAQLCTEKFSNVLCNEPIFDGWDADVIIPELKIAVMWNGPWHRRKITKKHSVKQVQTRDKIKVDKIRAAGYDEYVIDDDGKFNKKFVEEEFEKFLKFFKLSD